MTSEYAALIEEATKKSGLVWVNGLGMWHAWIDGATYVLCGGPVEQPAPAGLTDGATASVTVRSKDKGGRLVSWQGRAELLAPGSQDWSAAVAELRTKRLNSADADTVADRWAEQCTLFRLTPQGDPAEHPGAMPDGSGAAVPPVTPATTRQPMPAGLPRLLARRKARR
ncbi:hypothetical protein [Actinacidiphila bryophytorum]|uniref:hypothetical protein n=1 Tax=Actinacidiphila bryophytorum TaxID=1436133 RepID=UPI002176D26A|nr:hypothetical protein [Actinacidiphila bryophytorum]UWE12387.1 hypothetical protein NYE86_29350 [Actinacidiphila bryophytorum]